MLRGDAGTVRGRMTARRRTIRRAAPAACAALLGLAGFAVASPAAPATVAVGDVPALAPGAIPAGALAGATPLRLTIALASRDPAGLATLAGAVSDPASPLFHRYLTTAQFAARFGAAPASVAAVVAALRAGGLAAGPLAANGLSLPVATDAATASQSFGVSLRRFRERGADVFANTAAPRLPASLQGAVTDVLGLDDVPAQAPAGLVRGHAVVRGALAPQAAGGPVPCPAATVQTGGGAHTVDEIAHAYGIDGLYAGGDLGAGVTIALYELESEQTLAGDESSFTSCYGTSTTITTVTVPPGPGPPSGPSPGLETALDLDTVAGLAPAAAVKIFQGPNAGAGPLDTLATIVQDPVVKVISDSWGLCEPLNNTSEMSAENTLLAEAATAGQTFLAASGDRGSEDCMGSAALAVDDPASQPFATGVGGTTLTAVGPPTTETVWNSGGGAGGGGISTVWPMPAYQASSGAPGVLNVLSSGASCNAVAGSDCREVPDVSADAAPSTGYVVFYKGHWVIVGGTSAATPVWAGMAALADASGEGGCASQPLGFLNPSLFAIAAGPGASAALRDVTPPGNNHPGPSGLYPVTPGYDMATGLGTPIATDGATPGLVAQLCAALPPAVASVSPADAPPGATLTITGSGFAAGASVELGATAAANVAVSDSRTLTATVPAGSGSVDVTVTTAGGTSATVAADRFTYAPTETIAEPASGASYTQDQPVLAAFSCAASAAAAPACDGTVASGAVIDTSQPGAHQFTVSATDANGVATSDTVSYTVVPPPQATISVPADAAVYVQGRRVAASYACTTTAPVTIASCAGPVSSGAPLDTARTGLHRFAVAVTDSNGIATSVSAGYTVVAARPTVDSLRQSAAVWSERRHSSSQLPVGTTFTFSLDQAASVTLRFTRLARRQRHGVAAGRLRRSAAGGRVSVVFRGRTSTGPLAPGRYLVTVTATGIGGVPSRSRSLRFTVVRA
jgi:Pro-kumamolisin, activation domain/IPT/TIG domain